MGAIALYGLASLLIGIATPLAPIVAGGASVLLIAVGVALTSEAALLCLVATVFVLSPAVKLLGESLAGLFAPLSAIVADQRTIVAFAGVLLVRLLARRERLWIAHDLDLSVGAYVLVVLLSVVTALESAPQGDSFTIVLLAAQWAAYAAVYFLVSQLFRSEAAIRAGWVVSVVAVAAISGMALLQVAYSLGLSPVSPIAPALFDTSTNHLFVSVEDNRIFGPFVNVGPNVLGATLLMLIALLSGYRRLHLTRLASILASAAIVAGLAVLVATLSRAAILGLVVFTVARFAFTRSMHAMLLAGTALVATAVALLSPVGQDVIATVRVEPYFARTIETRFALWSAIVERVAGSPLLGLGFAGVARLPLIERAAPAENQYLTELAEHGILGLAALAALISAAVIRGVTVRASREWQLFNLEIAAGVLGVAVAFAGGSLLSYGQFSAFFWIALALGTASRTARDASGERPQATASAAARARDRPA